MYVLPELPYPEDSLAPRISARTLKFHHGKHHANYVTNLNKLNLKRHCAAISIESVILTAHQCDDVEIFNNASQCWNHSFFWSSMDPAPNVMSIALSKAIRDSFGNLGCLEAAFIEQGAGHFGSGWVWLVAKRTGELRVLTTHDA